MAAGGPLWFGMLGVGDVRFTQMATCLIALRQLVLQDSTPLVLLGLGQVVVLVARVAQCVTNRWMTRDVTVEAICSLIETRMTRRYGASCDHQFGSIGKQNRTKMLEMTEMSERKLWITIWPTSTFRDGDEHWRVTCMSQKYCVCQLWIHNPKAHAPHEAPWASSRLSSYCRRSSVIIRCYCILLRYQGVVVVKKRIAFGSIGKFTWLLVVVGHRTASQLHTTYFMIWVELYRQSFPVMIALSI